MSRMTTMKIGDADGVAEAPVFENGPDAEGRRLWDVQPGVTRIDGRSLANGETQIRLSDVEAEYDRSLGRVVLAAHAKGD